MFTTKRKAPRELMEKLQSADFPKRYLKSEYAWMHKQIQEDLSNFSCYSSACIDEEVRRFDTKANILVRIKVLDNRLYVRKPNAHLMKTSRKMHRSVLWVLNIVKDFCNAKIMPNLDIVICTQDFLSAEGAYEHAAPILVFSKNINVAAEKPTIMIPDFESLHFVLHDMEPLLKQYTRLEDFDQKRNIILFRGGPIDATGFRQRVNDYAKGKKYINAAVITATNRSLSMTKDQQLAYKYNLSIDGATATWSRMVWMLATNTLLLKHDSPNRQWYYNAIQPYVHYIPVSDQIEQLFPLYQWLENNQNKVRAIVKNGMDFATKHLTPEAFYGYYYLLFQAYAKKQGGQITTDELDHPYDLWGIVYSR